MDFSKVGGYFLCGLVNFCFLALADQAVAEVPSNKARVHYMINCQGCHTEDGAQSLDGAVPEMKDYVGNFLRVPEGRAYLVQVPGSANAPVSDSELANLLNWILINIAGDSTPTNFTPYTAEEVRLLRGSSIDNVAELRTTLVAHIAELAVSQ